MKQLFLSMDEQVNAQQKRRMRSERLTQQDAAARDGSDRARAPRNPRLELASTCQSLAQINDQ
jgi:hypothetical protein